MIATLVLLAPAIYTAKIALGGRDSQPARPKARQAQVVLVTFGRWPMVDGLPPGEAFDRIRSRSVDVGPVFAASDHIGAAAVSLVTGRHAIHHGVVDDESALPEGSWTWATSARDTGSPTAVISQERFVGRHRIEGFERIVEDPSQSVPQMASAALEFLNDHAEARKFLWLHIERPGADGVAAGELLTQIKDGFDELDQLSEVLWVVTALSGPSKLEEELALRVPLFVELPTAFNSRLTPTAHLSHVDLAGTFTRFLHQGWPRLDQGQVAPQSRTAALEAALGGIRSMEWIWAEGDFGHVVRIPPRPGAKRGLRIEVPDSDPGAEPQLEVRHLTDLHQGPAGVMVTDPGELDSARQKYLEIRGKVLAGATKATRSDP